MEAKELPVTNEHESRTEKPNKKTGRVTKLQAFLILFTTLIICLVGGYFISEKYLWPNADEQRQLDQLNYYKDLVGKKPNDPENRVNLGYTYFLTGNNDDAIKQLKVAIDLDKNYFGAYFNLGLVYLDEKRYNDALTQAQKTVELAPKNYKSNLLEGMVFRKLKMYDEALKSLQQALTLSPINTDIINEIAGLSEDQGKYDEAEKLYKEALSYDPLYKPATEGLERIAAKKTKKDNK
jgi:tetratricopeptide (TPR) repeat protein